MKQLNLIDKAFLLKKTNFFGSLDLDLLLTISDKMDWMSFDKGDHVFQINQNPHKLYLIVEGKISIWDKAGKKIADLGFSEFFGDEGIFNQKMRGYAALCETPAALLTLSRSHLLSIIDECPSVALALLEAYSKNIDFRKR